MLVQAVSAPHPLISLLDTSCTTWRTRRQPLLMALLTRHWDLCRDFRRASAAGEVLKEAVVNQLLLTLDAGDLLLLVDQCKQAALELPCPIRHQQLSHQNVL